MGSVDDLKLTDNDQAEVDISLDRQLHAGTHAVERAVGLVGVANHYVSIEPGPNNKPLLADGSTLTAADTTSSVDIDQVFNTLDKPAQRGLSQLIRGQAQIYDGKGKEANASYKYLEPALGQTNLVLRQLNRDSAMFSQFLVGGSRMFSALADRYNDLSASLTNARQAFDAINSQTAAFSKDLELIAPVFRQSEHDLPQPAHRPRRRPAPRRRRQARDQEPGAVPPRPAPGVSSAPVPSSARSTPR